MKNKHFIRIVSIIVLTFFAWTFGGIFDIAYAVEVKKKMKNIVVDKGSKAANKKTVKPKDSTNSQSNAKKLSNILEDIESILDTTESDNTTLKTKIKGKKNELTDLDKEIKKEFKETEKALKEAGLSHEILNRHSDFVKKYEDNYNEVVADITEIENAASSNELQAAVDKTKKKLDAVKPAKHEISLDPNKLPHRAVEETDVQYEEITENKDKTLNSKGKKDSASILKSSPPADDDLAETIEVKFTQLIKDKAAELEHNPVKIYNWVRNNVEYVPTYGSIQGADYCLQTMQCNAFDTASLLIALLRTSGIHARYMFGTIEIPIEKIMNWVGGFTDAKAALSLIASGGIPVTGLVEGGQVKAVRMEQVWVEAWVDFIPSMGTQHKKGDTWIRLDPSFKQYEYKAGIDLSEAVPFDAEGLINNLVSSATINEEEGWATNVDQDTIKYAGTNYYAQKVNYLNKYYPNPTVKDIFGSKKIIKHNFNIFMATLPYKTRNITVSYNKLPDSMRYKIKFTVESNDIVDKLNISYSLPEIAAKKITLSYTPATSEDEEVIKSYLPKIHSDGTAIDASELPISLPSYLINVKSELRINGQIVASGDSVPIGTAETFYMTFIDPVRGKDIVSNIIQAGEYFGIDVNISGFSVEQITNIKTKLEKTKIKMELNNFTNLTNDDVLGDLLYTIATVYNIVINGYDSIDANVLNVISIKLPSEAIFKTSLTTDNYYGIPVSVSSSGLTMDVDRNLSIIKALDGNNI
ncbi:MAG: hypothetical protein L3V56_10770 [Candidatus Magnetoovum sp. WYHC-5]|nr:hypothetical protein [Candidatus Magnetoovum sp. WYHC-5]